MSDRYRQHDFAPGQSLLCRWDYAQGAQTTPALVLPDACVDLLWDGARLSVAGPDTQAQHARLAPGQRLQGLRFAPTVAAHWLGAPLHVLANQRVEVSDLGVPRLTRLTRQMADHGPEAIDWLAGQILADARPRTDAMQAVHARLSAPHPMPIAQLAVELGLTERTLLRHCDDAFGYGPKMLARILRLQRFLHAQRRTATLLEAALDAGYYDAAQLAGEVRRLTGMTPTQLVLQVAG